MTSEHDDPAPQGDPQTFGVTHDLKPRLSLVFGVAEAQVALISS